MIDPGELRTWLLRQVDDAALEATEPSARVYSEGAVDMALRVGEAFGVLTADDVASIRERLGDGDVGGG